MTFPQNVTTCALSISAAQYLGGGVVGINANTIDPPDASHYFFSVLQDISTANSMAVGERDASAAPSRTVRSRSR